MHVAKQLVLITDDSGRVTLVDINGTVLNDDLYPNFLFEPTAIDVDWLNNYAYIVDGHKVM